MSYEKQTWVPYDENKSEEENIKNGSVGTSERMNHIEDGIKGTDTNLSTHKNDSVSHVTQIDRDKWDKKLQSSDVANYQKKKVTNDDGSQIVTAGGNVTLLQAIIGQGVGYRAISASPSAADNPSGQALRGTALMNSSTSGNFIGMTEDGWTYSRAISGGKWIANWNIVKPDLVSSVTKMKVVFHRGFNNNSPENTAYSFKQAKKKGAEFVETDISYTKDNIPVILHDETINRTARNDDGSVITAPTKILDLTLEQAKTYDFGIAWGEQYKGQRILTLDEFILLCKRLGLNIYLELKESVNGPRCQMIIDILNKYNYYNNILFVGSFYNLNIMKSYAPDARLGYVTNVTDTALENAAKLRTGRNEVFINTNINTLTDKGAQKVADLGFGLEVWTADTAALVDKALNYNVLGITTNFYDVVGHLIDRDGI